MSRSVSSNGTKNFDKGCRLVCNRQIYLGHFALEGPNAFDSLHLIYSCPEDPINSTAVKDVLHRGLTSTASDRVAEAVNAFFEHLITKATKSNEIRDYYSFLVIGYGNEEKENYASLAWEGTLKGKEWVSVKELSENIQEKIIKTEWKVPYPGGEPTQQTKTEKVWIKPKSNGNNTPMLSALKLCKEKLEKFIETRSDNFPPVVFNITDGLPTDINDLSELIEVSNQIKNIDTSFGNTVLFNCLLSNLNENRIRMPTLAELEKIDSNKFHKALFEASSILPEFILKEAFIMLKEDKFNQSNPIKALTLNIKPSEVLPIFKIGTNTNL